MNDDGELLQAFVETGSEPAFTEIVERYKGLVYGVALRQTADGGLAEEITQAVFIAFSRKARTLKPGIVLAGWLFRATRFAANDLLKRERRRMRREQFACAMNSDNSISSPSDELAAWQEIAPVLDESLARLGERERHSLLLRFFQQKKFADVGDALDLSEAGARKCVDRALESLRTLLARRGVVVPLALLSGLLTTNGAPAVPIALSIGAGVVGGTPPLVKGILLFMTWTKTKITISAVAAGILLIGGAMVLLQVLPHATQRANAPANQLANAAFVVRGTVRSADRKPLAGALVRVGTPEANVRLYLSTNSVAATPTNGPNNPLTPSAVTAADGSFYIGLSAVPRAGKAAVVVTDNAGYALTSADDLSANPEMVVQPWGRIEGVLRIGKSLASNQTVFLTIWGSQPIYDWNLVSHWQSTQTDANGRFVFTRVAPMDVWLTHDVMVRPGDARPSGHHHVKVGPGDEIHVQLGGVGRVIAGRIEWNGDDKLIFHGSMWANQKHYMREPRGWRAMSAEERRKYELEWRASPEGELFKEEVRNYEFPVQPDGTFRVPDVLPGSYRMQVRADAPTEPGKPSRKAAVVETKVIVPEILPGEADEPIDIGTLSPSSRANR